MLHPEIHPGPNQLGNTYISLPFSASFRNDALLLHANAGWLRDHASSQERMTWGLAGEWQASADPASRWLALGLRWMSARLF